MSLQAYNSATDTLTPIAENDYKNSLEKVSALPTASADLLNKCYLLTANQGTYVKGGIYQCQSDGSSGYTWILINGSGVPVDIIEDGNMNAVTSNAVSDKFDTLGTASVKDSTDVVRTGSHDLVESNAVANAINQALSSIYVPRGSLSCAELTSALLIDANVGNVYEMSDSGTTSTLFIQGAGTTISVGDNVGIIKAGESTYMFNYMGNAFDLTDYQKKELTTPITIGEVQQTTVEGALGALQSAKVDSSTLGRFKTMTVTLSPRTQRTISFSNVAKRVRIDIDSTGANNNTQFHGVLVGYNEMTSNRLIGLYKRGTNGLLASMNSYEITIANPSETATDTVIFTFYNLAGNITMTISDESAITLTEMGNGWQELVTNEIVPSYASVSNLLVASSDLSDPVVYNTDLYWTDADIKTAIARICNSIENGSRINVETRPVFVKDFHNGGGAGTCVVRGNGVNYLYGIYFTYYMGAIYKFNAIRIDDTETVELIKFSGTVI